jgi:hypothetical protein
MSENLYPAKTGSPSETRRGLSNMGLAGDDLKNLRYARDLLENPGLAAKIANRFGTPIEKGFKLLPVGWSEAVLEATRVALRKVLDLAVITLNEKTDAPSTDWIHKMMVATTGAAGGAFGLMALSVELPLSTMIMFRSVADIARSEGEEIRSIYTKLACLEVFALGGKSSKDDATETGYFAVRMALASALSKAINYIAQKGLMEEGAPVLVRLITKIASRFSVVVSEKVAAQAVPIVGAVGGALVNTIFMDHFQDIARGHFIIRRLERYYGPEEVQRQYESL